MTLSAKTARSEQRPAPALFSSSRFAAQPHHPKIIPTDDPRLCYVEPAYVQKLAGRLRAQTPDCVMDTFGISVNTWVKMRKGLPIRKSVAERLVKRFGADLQ